MSFLCPHGQECILPGFNICYHLQIDSRTFNYCQFFGFQFKINPLVIFSIIIVLFFTHLVCCYFLLNFPSRLQFPVFIKYCFIIRELSCLNYLFIFKYCLYFVVILLAHLILCFISFLVNHICLIFFSFLFLSLKHLNFNLDLNFFILKAIKFIFVFLLSIFWLKELLILPLIFP